MISYKLVPAHIAAGEIAPVIRRHHKEMNISDDYGDLNPDWDSYIQASLSGGCVVFMAHDGDKLVGYSIFQISSNPRYKTVIEAWGDGFYLEKYYQAKYAMELISKAEKAVKEYGAHRVHYILDKNEPLGKLLKRKGYKSTSEIWSIK